MAGRCCGELIGLPEAARWDAALDGLSAGPRWSHAYAAAIAASAAGVVALWRYDESDALALCPVLVRDGPACDVATPYGMAGFLGRGDGGAALNAFRRFGAEAGWAAAYVSVDPQAPWDFAAEAALGPEIYRLDLTPGADALWAGLAKQTRQDLRRAARAGTHRIVDAPHALGRALRDLYPPFIRRAGAAPVYRFSEATLEALARLPAALLLGAEGEDGVDAVSLFLVRGGEAVYALSAAADRPGARDQGKVLLWEGITRLSGAGATALDLGGGVRPGDGLARFKARFGARPTPTRALRLVFRPETYAAACRAAGADPASDGYFPPYRAPGLRSGAAAAPS